MYTAAALLYPHALATSVTLPFEILQAASQMASVKSRSGPQVRMLLAAPEAGPMRLASGLTLQPDTTFSELPARELAQWILDDRLPVRMQVQLHKIIWGEERAR